MSVHSHIGPMTRTVADAALFLTIAAGEDARDRNSWTSGIDYAAEINQSVDISGLRVAWSPDLGYAEVELAIVEVAERAAKRFE
ncbi:MAG: amidase family protein [Thermomicrobiales bacterium]